MDVEFHTLLVSQGCVFIPKAIVERFRLWEGTPIQVTLWIRGYKKSGFPTVVRKGWMFTVPKRERVFHGLRRKEPLTITITTIEEGPHGQ